MVLGEGARQHGHSGLIQRLTDFADQAVILPVFALAGLGLAACGRRQAAFAWFMVIPVVFGLVLAGKLFTYSCASLIPAGWGLHSPSGHTASAAVVYGGLTALLVPSRHPRWVAVIAATGFAIAIGLSRIALGVHTVTDVMVGAPLGITGAYALVRFAGPRPLNVRRATVMAVTVFACALLLTGNHLKAESAIGRAAAQIWPLTECR
jgi:membrane-associated phospholipid phosphatase